MYPTQDANAVGTSRETHIQQSIMSLERATSELQKVTDELSQRLMPITRPDGGEKLPIAASPKAIRVALSEGIEERIARIDLTVARLRDVIGRLEL